MVRFGGILIFFGFGSALLHLTSVQFRLMMWAEPVQPVLGLVVGTLGVGLVVLRFALSKRDSAATEPQGFGPPPEGYAPLPAVQRDPRQPGLQQQPPFPPGQQGLAAPQAQQQWGGQRPEPVLGRPQFAPQVPAPTAPAAPPRQAPLPQFPPAPRRLDQQPAQPFGPVGGIPTDQRG
ncbi:hypothetical protein [Actinophytocola xanthii]|uniref:Uncharacterized protein n=1 Tax=Actinophytocola xanthii TaxID=1912961 RepID=A0A1Q8CQT7_9PSEU|nr:hypothetical protein [Actinophytocola xanthii]OLF16719.1 hypothetical protein BU204_14690 [Actinophytocola xanthii]